MCANVNREFCGTFLHMGVLCEDFDKTWTAEASPRPTIKWCAVQKFFAPIRVCAPFCTRVSLLNLSLTSYNCS